RTVISYVRSIMEELSRLFFGEYAKPKEKIKMMGDFVIMSKKEQEEKCDEEIRAEVMDRFERLGLAHRASTVSYLEEEISNEGFRSIIFLLYRLSLTIDDSQILKHPHQLPIPSFELATSSHFNRNGRLNLMGKKEEEKSVVIGSPDDGCADSGRDVSSSLSTRLPSGHLTHEYLNLLKTRTRANPNQRQCIEVSMSSLSISFCDALSAMSSYIFRIQDGMATTVSPLVISNQSISQTRVFIRPIVEFINDILLAEKSLQACIDNSNGDLPSQLCHTALSDLKELRHESVLLLYSRPFPNAKSIRSNMVWICKKGDQFICLSRLLLRLNNSSCAECLDALISILTHDSLDSHLSLPILNLLTFALLKTLEHAEYFMLTGEISQLGLILETNQGSTIDEEYRGGRIEGERWRKNYGIRVGHGQSIDKETADEIMAEGKLALMRMRDPTLVAEFSSVAWLESKWEREEERKKIVKEIKPGVTARDVRMIFKDSIRWVRTRGDRSIFLSKQIRLVANSLEIVWQVFLLGDRVTRVPLFDSMMDRFNSMRDAISAFHDDHLLAVSYASKNKSRSSASINLRVSGALSIVVSSSNIAIYTDAHKLLSKLSQVYHQLSQSYLCLPCLNPRSDEIMRGLHKGLAEITHWVGKLCDHFCTQVHEVVWKQTSKEVLSSLPSFDVLFSVHRKALKQLANRLLLQSNSASLSSALDASIDASSHFSRSIQSEDWEKAGENYTDFIEAAQMFTHGLMVGEDPLGLRAKLLFLIDPLEKFRM
ncbi:hypothetical protein PFISCL1PPCAC_15216, partial [Pristionchus fissidentatus]